MSIVVRFSQLTENTNSPITIRFEVVPGVPFDWGQIGIEVATAYKSYNTQVDVESSLAWSISRVDNEIAVSYTGLARVGNVYDLVWSPVDNHENQLVISYAGLECVEQTIAPEWGVTASYTNEILTNWLKPLQFEISLTTPWFGLLPKLENQTDVFYESPQLPVMTNMGVMWRSGSDQVETEFNLFYGPHPSGFICTTNYLPPKGKVLIRFDSPHSLNGPNVTMRFTPSPEYCYYDDGGGLIDGGTELPNIDFDIPIEPQIRRVYLMQPELVVTRVSDNLPIVVTSVSISDNRGQFTSSGSIDFSSRGDALNAINQLLLVQINGYDFYLLPEEIGRNQSFGQSQWSASCRSRTAQLAAPLRAPISYSNTVDRSVAGIMGDILTASGWSVELVGFLDFNVPAGVFSITGKAPIESVNEIADMIGCIVIPDEFTSVLKIVPRWPVTPWTFASAVPAIAVHDAVIISYSSRDELNQLCDSCWVRGEQQGVSRHVKRTGTAGNIPTSDVSNALIVTDTAARLVGTAKIADTGKKERITISLPVMNDLPPLVKGMLIGVSYFGEIYKATCDSVSISASVNTDGDIDVTQTANLIRHME